MNYKKPSRLAVISQKFIPKGDGAQRPLGISCVKDRIVQSAVKMTLEPRLSKTAKIAKPLFSP